jgi:hypothetical protein
LIDSPYDHLLTYLSEKGHGRWIDFLKAIKLLDLEESAFGIAIRLCHLAHLDFDSLSIENTKDWSISTPCLALTVDKHNEAQAVLYGKRNPAFLQALSAAATRNNVRVIFTEQEKGPSVITFKSETMDNLNRAVTQVGITMVQKPAWKIILVLPQLNSLVFSTLIDHPLYGEIHRFDLDQFKWKPVQREDRDKIGDGLYRFGNSYRLRHALISSHKAWHVEAESGIWWILSRLGKNVLRWSRSKQELSLPYMANPPLLLTRALVLCSGYLPTVRNSRSYFIGINEPIARYTAEWLGQNLEVCE